MITAIEALKDRVRTFLEAQPGFSQQPIQNLEVAQEDVENVSVIYGDNLWAGIAGLGNTTDGAYNDFVNSWKRLKGFEWIEKNRLSNKAFI